MRARASCHSTGFPVRPLLSARSQSSTPSLSKCARSSSVHGCIGLARGAEPFITLEEQLEAALASAGWARDPRGFTPHLTIGRVREPGRDWSTVLDGVGSLGERALAAFRVDRIRVVRSEMHPGGSTYHTVGEAVLAEP